MPCPPSRAAAAAAETCISDAHLAVTIRLCCVFHMTVVTHGSADLPPRRVRLQWSARRNAALMDFSQTCSAAQVGGWSVRAARAHAQIQARTHAHTHMGWLEVDSRRRVAWMRWRQHISVIYGVQEDHYGHFNLSLMDVSKCLLSWSLMAPCNQWNTWPPLPPQLNPPAILFFLKRGPRGLSFKRR